MRHAVPIVMTFLLAVPPHGMPSGAVPPLSPAPRKEERQDKAPTQNQKEAGANSSARFHLKSLAGAWDMFTLSAGGGAATFGSGKRVIITQPAPGVIAFSFSDTETRYREISSFPNPIRIPEQVTRRFSFRLKQGSAAGNYLLTVKISSGLTINNLPLTFNEEGELVGEGLALVDGEKFSARASIKVDKDGEHTWTLAGSDAFSISFSKPKRRSRAVGKQ